MFKNVLLKGCILYCIYHLGDKGKPTKVKEKLKMKKQIAQPPGRVNFYNFFINHSNFSNRLNTRC